MEKILNSKQLHIQKILILSLPKNYNQADKKIKSQDIISKFEYKGIKITGGELREVIGNIRRNDLCAPGFILSDRNGYWYSEDEIEMKACWEAEHSRALNIMKNFAPLHKRFLHLISEQNSIFTYLKTSQLCQDKE